MYYLFIGLSLHFFLFPFPKYYSINSPHRPPSPDQDEGQITFDVEMPSQVN